MFKFIGYNDGRDLIDKTFTFNGGEEYVRLHDTAFLTGAYSLNFGYKLIAHLNDSSDVMKLLMIKDAFDRLTRDVPQKLDLVIPYLPYARQDRVCVPGESHSLAVMAKLINGCNFNSVTLVDPHSHVAEALIDNVRVVTQLNVIANSPFNEFVMKNFDNIVLVSPDAGANKKTFEVAKYFGKPFIRADKLRDLATGQIKETIVYADDLTGKTAVILDDICDGGRTFIELAKVLKAKGAAKVILFVTHGIFSAGLRVLFNGGIDSIWTTDTFDFSGTVSADDVQLQGFNLIPMKEYTRFKN